MITVCPYCGSTDGYYEKIIQRYAQFYTFDNLPDCASEFVPVRGGDRKYCTSCNKDITKALKGGDKDESIVN